MVTNINDFKYIIIYIIHIIINELLYNKSIFIQNVISNELSTNLKVVRKMSIQ